MATRKIVTGQNNFNKNGINNFLQRFFSKKIFDGGNWKDFLLLKFKVQYEEKLLNDQNFN